MRLKVYRAATATAAIGRIRAELGADALILATRRVADGVEITAALEQEDGTEPPPLIGRVTAALEYHRVPADLARRLSESALAEALAHEMPFEALELQQGAQPILLAGPPGAGKTLTTARLATRLVMNGAAPVVVTADGRRAGATEQLAAFTRILGISLVIASHPMTLARAVSRRRDGAPVLVDLPGSDPFLPQERDELMALASAAGARLVVVMPAGIDPSEAGDLAAAYHEAGARQMVATKLDLARRIGGVLAAAEAGLALAEAGIGPGASDGLVPMTPALLADRLLQIPHDRRAERLA